ncbi:hypothetical protein EMIHUDRAFT_426517 [Emiliania huxleyi CCMP1516]|uniref:GPN-loop GTPase n=2 Tax=Emiliania huxleyi TaxID=2903 RepID=A0A0D3KIE2_EMIH1|nr:hypothetical protein EMIHUDRAFT_426517 [Emiliania huxleyi CCMP1516]EOD35527.1 hypothetical protein EMIHUDRAFT_426517 [Emiliania huxleyi CCMP1516]|eukprot:XP_005787956.1 hypothetical protein EMIHUDRAFT_426517 [Emiliania huxleyi CCMP1516]
MDDAGSSSAGAPSSAGGQAGATRRPVACIVLGMAGSGKTTLMQRLNSHLHEAKRPYYLINLDPAVLDTPFGANIDIRDTVNYKEVMKQYSLGPNGGILTSLNLFATKFHEVLGLVEARAEELDFVLLDTPGQIEIFTWSASGAIISESLAASMPTVVVYVVDTPRCSSAVTFMSNMLYACSILYKTKLPLLLVFNKTDTWMSDLDAFRDALQEEKSYMGTLATSMALMLEEFYAGLTSVGLSARTGEGVDDFFDAVQRAAAEYDETYGAELAARKKAAAEAEAARRRGDLGRFREDRRGGGSGEARSDESEEEGEGEDEDEEGDGRAGFTKARHTPPTARRQGVGGFHNVRPRAWDRSAGLVHRKTPLPPPPPPSTGG